MRWQNVQMHFFHIQFALAPRNTEFPKSPLQAEYISWDLTFQTNWFSVVLETQGAPGACGPAARTSGTRSLTPLRAVAESLTAPCQKLGFSSSSLQIIGKPNVCTCNIHEAESNKGKLLIASLLDAAPWRNRLDTRFPWQEERRLWWWSRGSPGPQLSRPVASKETRTKSSGTVCQTPFKMMLTQRYTSIPDISKKNLKAHGASCWKLGTRL